MNFLCSYDRATKILLIPGYECVKVQGVERGSTRYNHLIADRMFWMLLIFSEKVISGSVFFSEIANLSPINPPIDIQITV